MLNPLFYKGNPASKYVGRVGVTIFGNALGEGIVGKIQRVQAEKQTRATQRAIASQGVDYFRDQLAISGATPQEIDAFVNSAEAQRLVDSARAITGAADQYGKPFDQLTADQKAEVLKPLYQRIFEARPGAQFDTSGIPNVDAVAGPYEPTLIESAASVLDTGAQGVNRLVQAVGGERVAAGLVTGVQAAIYGVPKTVLDLAVGELTERPIAYVSEKVSDLLQRSVFEGTGDAESVRSVSDTLSSFAVSSVFDTGLGVVGSAGKYGAAKKATQLARGFEQQVRDLYPGSGLQPVPYQAALPDGSFRTRYADAVATINGVQTAIEAKFSKDFSKSIYNPDSKIGGKSFAQKAREDFLGQARDYSRNFEQVIYHTNSPELQSYYNDVFANQGLTNVKFVLTPVNQ